MEHTSEPWIVLPPSTGVDANWHVTDDGDTFVAHVFGSNHAVDEQSHIDALRIVACVNACAGIPTEQLERGGLEMPLLSTLADIRTALGVGDKPMLSELAGEAGRIKRERDDAVEALKVMLRRHGCVEGCCAQARAELAKIEGERS